MDPLTGASTFANLVSLLSIFKSERTASAADEHEEFMQWLQKKRYDSLIQEITSNHLLGLSIKSLLNQNHHKVVSELNALQGVVAKLASRLSGLNQIATSISPTIPLSDQALSVLKQLDKSGGSTFLELKTLGSTGYMIMDGAGEHIDIPEPRFADDDLAMLVELGLLRLDRNSRGDRLWKLTREASRLVSQTEQ